MQAHFEDLSLSEICHFPTQFSKAEIAPSTLCPQCAYQNQSFLKLLYIFTNGRPSSTKQVQWQLKSSKNDRERGYMKIDTFRETPCI